MMGFRATGLIRDPRTGPEHATLQTREERGQQRRLRGLRPN